MWVILGKDTLNGGSLVGKSARFVGTWMQDPCIRYVDLYILPCKNQPNLGIDKPVHTVDGSEIPNNHLGWC